VACAGGSGAGLERPGGPLHAAVRHRAGEPTYADDRGGHQREPGASALEVSDDCLNFPPADRLFLEYP